MSTINKIRDLLKFDYSQMIKMVKLDRESVMKLVAEFSQMEIAALNIKLAEHKNNVLQTDIKMLRSELECAKGDLITAESIIAKRDQIIHCAGQALKSISDWREFPAAHDQSGRPCSYAVAYGSNGERDYMRGIANEALELINKSRPEINVSDSLDPVENVEADKMDAIRKKVAAREPLSAQELVAYMFDGFFGSDEKTPPN